MDIGSTFIAHAQPAVLRQPRQRAFDHPAVAPQTAAMGCAALCQDRGDTQSPQGLAMGLRIIAPITLEALRPSSWAPTLPPHRRNRRHQWQKLRAIMPVRACQPCRQRNPLGICHEMMFRARLAAVRRIGAGFFPHRPRRGRCDYPQWRGTNRCARRRAVWPIRPHAGAARRQPHANPADGASRSCRSHSPSPGATAPREGQTSGQRQYRSMLLARTREVYRLWVSAVQGVTTEQSAPRVRRGLEVLPYLHCTAQ